MLILKLLCLQFCNPRQSSCPFTGHEILWGAEHKIITRRIKEKNKAIHIAGRGGL
jgi:hypothetical protein